MELLLSESSESTVDTSRQFRSVREAVAVFDERILMGKSIEKSKKESVVEALKKVEAELQETKAELKKLKERASIEKKIELRKRMEKNATLAHIMSLGLGETHTNGMSMKTIKNKNKVKPIVPLVSDLFALVMRKSSSLHTYH